MKFKWYLTVDFPVSSYGHSYDDDEERMNTAILEFQNAQEKFFEYLDSRGVEYEVLNDESK
jgi:hypothetical protein